MRLQKGFNLMNLIEFDVTFFDKLLWYKRNETLESDDSQLYSSHNTVVDYFPSSAQPICASLLTNRILDRFPMDPRWKASHISGPHRGFKRDGERKHPPLPAPCFPITTW